MTNSAALQFPHSAFVAVAPILFAAWIAVHVLHDRRLRRFGDPRLLGLGRMWPRRICTGILLAGAAGALLALVGDAVAPATRPGKGANRVLLLVDPPRPSLRMSSADPDWEGCGRDLLRVAESAEPGHIAFYVTGSPPRLVVPYTRDVRGAMLVLEAGSSGYEASSAGVLETSVEAVRLGSIRTGDAEAASAVVVVSPRAEHEIDAVANALTDGPPVIFVRMGPGGSRKAYRREGPNALWTPLDAPDSIGSVVRAMARRGTPEGRSNAQVLALMAFLLLYLEWAVGLAWPARGGIGRCTVHSADFNGRRAVEGSSLKVLVCLLVVMSLTGERHAFASQSGNPEGASHLATLDSLGPHAAVVTEMSDDRPYVGQQFSVVYRLRCSVPPVAVDVDPQDFAGFWSVAVQTPAEARPDPVTLNGRAARDFLLRQMIVFPMKPGRQVLPVLRLKIKQDISSRDEWDVTRQTSPVAINVRPVPGAADSREVFFMVGNLEAAVSGTARGDSQEAVLELAGTANLGLFRPELWLKDRNGDPLQVRLKSADTLVQTRDYDGRRRLTLLQRQRWVVGPAAGRSGIEVGSQRIPVFDPESSRWRSVEIGPFRAGFDVPGPGPAGDAHSSAGLRQQRGNGIGLLTPVTIAFTVSCLALLAVVVTGRLRRGE